MLDKYSCLRKLAEYRRENDIVVTTMSCAAPWAALSNGPLDFASVDSAMGHAADFAYGLALSQPLSRYAGHGRPASGGELHARDH